MARKGRSVDELVAGVAAGDRRALARAISLVENRDAGAAELVGAVYPRTGRSAAFGVTGPPGVGKSSLIGALIRHVRESGSTVGVVSVDPSSPFTQGALLGDRIRLADHFLDPGVYIRSMSTRGHLGGLAEAALQTLLLLDAAGYDVVFLETVGAGQSEVEVIGIADVVLLVLMPGSGDSVQALKAGIMEIPDVIAVNKSDHATANAMLKEVRSVVALEPEPGKRPLVLPTDALRGDGVPDLWRALVERRDALIADGTLEERRRRNLAAGVTALAAARARERIERAVARGNGVRGVIERVQQRLLDPVTAADEIVSAVLGEERDGTSDDR